MVRGVEPVRQQVILCVVCITVVDTVLSRGPEGGLFYRGAVRAGQQAMVAIMSVTTVFAHGPVVCGEGSSLGTLKR